MPKKAKLNRQDAQEFNTESSKVGHDDGAPESEEEKKKREAEEEQRKAKEEEVRRKKKNDNMVIANFVALKKTHDATVQQAKELLEALDNDPDYAWAAKNEILISPVNNELQNIKGLKNSTPVWKAWCIEQKSKLLLANLDDQFQDFPVYAGHTRQHSDLGSEVQSLKFKA